MEKKMNKKALLLSLVFALIACVLVFNYIKNLKKPEEVQSKVTLLVAARNINVGEEIKASDINAIEVSKDSLPAGTLEDRSAIEGFYAQQPIIMGEPFRQERLAEKEALTLAYNIPDGMRAISVFVNENNIFSNQLRIGDKVDVIGNFKKEMPDGKTIASSMIIIQNTEILAIGPERLQQENTTDETKKDASDQSKLPRTVTLCVSPSDAEKVAFSAAFGDFTLILRGHKDEAKVKTSGTIIDFVTPF